MLQISRTSTTVPQNSKGELDAEAQCAIDLCPRPNTNYIDGSGSVEEQPTKDKHPVI